MREDSVSGAESGGRLMPVSEWLKGILVCPVDHSIRLVAATPEVLDRVNQAIADGRVRNRGGQTVTVRLEAALVRADGAILYPVVNGIPVLMADEGIDLTGL